MEHSHRVILKQNRETIVSDLDVSYILDFLIQKFVLTDEQRQEILSEKTSQAQARRLLDILPTRGKDAFGLFVESLRRDYEWLAEQLQNSISGSTDCPDGRDNMKILMRGGVPKHQNFVERDEMQKTIKALRELQKERYVVLHGMPGSGKSVIAAQSLWCQASSLITEFFQDGVFWVKVGDVQPEQLLGKIRALCTKLDASPLPNDIEQGQEILRKIFLSDTYCNCLLVLDDVWKPEVVRAFQLPVKIMITTQDTSIMDVVSGRSSFINCQKGFTEEQSLQCFEMSLKIKMKDLPEVAREIHSQARGCPMIISLVSSLLSQSPQKDQGRWNYYLNNISERRYCKIKKQTSYEHIGIMEAVKMSVEALDQAHREKYEQLAVFLDDDPIPSAVLEKLWSCDKYEVEEIMRTFEQKSLASSEWDSIQESYVYSFHDLYLEHLRKLHEDDEHQMHRDFINKYLDTVINDRYEDIENDNYIFTHLAFHLFKANMTEKFPDIFLNLLYLEKVIKECGTAVVLYDYRKYREFITRGPLGENQFEEEFTDLETFCRTSGVTLCSNHDADIVQLGLGESEDSFVYTKSKQIADEDPSAYYLEWSNRSGIHSRNIATVLHHDQQAKDLSFLPDRRIITATNEGTLKIWNWVNGEITSRLRGHTGPVNAISVEETNCLNYITYHNFQVCTGGQDGTVKFWRPGKMEDIEEERFKKNRRRSIRKPSPKTHMPPETLNQLFGSHSDDSVSQIKVDVSTENDGNEVTDVSWRPCYNQVAVATRSGTVIVFEDHRELFRINRHKQAVNTLAYDSTGDLLVLGSDDTTVTAWSSERGDYQADIRSHEHRVLQVAWLGTEHMLASISQENLFVWQNPGHGATVKELKRNRVASWTCVAANNVFIAAGTSSEQLIVLWSVVTMQVVAALPGHTSYIASLAFAQTSDDDDGVEETMLASLCEDMLMVWSVEGVQSDEVDPELLSLGPKHHTHWCDKVPTTAAPDDRNRITLLSNGRRVAESQPESHLITAIKISPGCKSVVYGTSAGEVKVFDPESKQVSILCTEMRTERGSSDCPAVLCLDISSQGVIVTGSGVLVRIFHPDGRHLICSSHSCVVRDVMLIREDTQVLSCDREGALKVWDLETGREMQEITAGVTSHSTCVTTWVNKQECLVAVSGVDKGVSVINLNTGQLVRKIAQDSPEIRVARFGPCGRYLVTGHDSGDVQVWSIKTGHQLLSSPLKLHESWVKDIAVSKDGKTMLTVGDRLVWWSLDCLSQQTSSVPIRKLSLPSRSRKSSESRSNRSSMHEENLTDCQLADISGGSITVTSPPTQVNSPVMKSPVLPVTPGTFSPTNVNRRIKQLPPGSPLSPAQRPRSLYSSHTTSPMSPHLDTKNRKVNRVGRQRELLQIFDLKGSSADKVFVNEDFTEFVTVDDAGILYILNEYQVERKKSGIFTFNQGPAHRTRSHSENV